MFGQKMKEERSRLGFTQPQLAELLSSSKRTLVDWENEKSSPTAKQLMMMFNLGFDVSYLLTGVRSVQALSTEEQLILDKYRQASPEVRNKMLLVLLGGGSQVNDINNSFNGRISNSFNQGGFTRNEYLIFALVSSMLSSVLGAMANGLLDINLFASVFAGVISLIFLMVTIGCHAIIHFCFKKEKST